MPEVSVIVPNYNHARFLRRRQRSRVLLDGEPGILPESMVFMNAWNEWGEGNHLEPCQRWGRACLETTERALAVGGRNRVMAVRVGSI